MENRKGKGNRIDLFKAIVKIYLFVHLYYPSIRSTTAIDVKASSFNNRFALIKSTIGSIFRNERTLYNAVKL